MKLKLFALLMVLMLLPIGVNAYAPIVTISSPANSSRQPLFLRTSYSVNGANSTYTCNISYSGVEVAGNTAVSNATTTNTGYSELNSDSELGWGASEGAFPNNWIDVNCYDGVDSASSGESLHHVYARATETIGDGVDVLTGNAVSLGMGFYTNAADAGQVFGLVVVMTLLVGAFAKAKGMI